MTQEDKDLLLKDLSARLPYGVICAIYRIDDWNVGWRDEKLTGYFYDGFAYEFYFGESPISIDNDISKIKPYLRPMESLTDEEEEEYEEVIRGSFEKQLEFYLRNHLDFRGLILKGLALEALDGMYNK